MGHRVREALFRHVRFRGVGSQPAEAVSGPRSARQEAALLHGRSGRLPALCLGTESAATASGCQAGDLSRGSRGLLRIRLRPRSENDLQWCVQTAAGQHAAGSGGRFAARATELLGRRSASSQFRACCGARGRAGDALATCGGRAAGRRRPSRSLPLGRRRLERGCRHDGWPVQRAGTDMLDLIR